MSSVETNFTNHFKNKSYHIMNTTLKRTGINLAGILVCGFGLAICRIALAQAGYRNRFNHPVPVVVARYEERRIRVVASPACGAVVWRSDKPEDVRCQRETAARYWHHAGVRSP